MQQQNHELLEALDELRQRQEDLSRLNAELQDMVNTLEERATTARVAAEQHIGVYGEEATFEDDTQDSDEGVEVVH